MRILGSLPHLISWGIIVCGENNKQLKVPRICSVHCHCYTRFAFAVELHLSMQFCFQVDLTEFLKKQSTKINNANYFADLQPETLLFISLSSSLSIPVFRSIRMRLEGSVPCLRISTGTGSCFLGFTSVFMCFRTKLSLCSSLTICSPFLFTLPFGNRCSGLAWRPANTS